jgi:type II secretory pathway pseudopilin PulG
MNSLRLRTGGYTIIEVMIVLVVSATLFIVAVTDYNRQNRRTEFTQAIRELELTVQDVLNDVSTGYYPNSNNIVCNPSASGPVITSGSRGHGTNQGCIFVGRALDLPSAAGDSTFEIYTIAGLQNDAAGNPVRDVDAAQNRAISVAASVESRTIPASITITKIIVGDGSIASPAESQGFAIVSGFGGSEVSGSGATTNQVSVASIAPGFNFTNTGAQVIQNANLNQDITICIEQAGGGRDAALVIGSGLTKLNIETRIDQLLAGCA